MTTLVSLPSQSGKSVPGSQWLQPQGAQAGGGTWENRPPCPRLAARGVAVSGAGDRHSCLAASGPSDGNTELLTPRFLSFSPSGDLGAQERS